MSAQFGKCNFDGKPVDTQELSSIRPDLAPYGPDAEGLFRDDNVGIIYRAFHTTKESKLEDQPHVSPSGAIITWDGRLDNRSELLQGLRGELSNESTDLSIVTAAFEQWGTGSFAKLIGDWAVSIWEQGDQALILAKDPIGTHQLYYSLDDDHVTWSTLLEPLVLHANRSLSLNEEYIAGWLSSYPAAHLTPYVGVHSVPPSCFVKVEKRTRTITKYWDFNPATTILYRADADYEEHFRSVFMEAVRRRLRSHFPTLAELSGGMDSSSIVCMADALIDRGRAETPRLDTISYYDDSEPNWNERPYFTKVEEKRGRTGCHIDISLHNSFNFESDPDIFAATPASAGYPKEISQQIATRMAAQENRVLLSGIGGDEVTGGVPTPLPELEDLLANAQFRLFAHRLKAWAINKRKPWFRILFEAVRGFCPHVLVTPPKHKRPAPWLRQDFVNRNRSALAGYVSRLKLNGARPSFQENISTLEGLRRQIACSAPLSDPPCENRYPYLDRDLLEFMYAIPREQLVRPSQRRSLMRRALAGVVPDEVLNRKRKAFGFRGPLIGTSTEWGDPLDLQRHMLTDVLGIVDAPIFCAAVQMAHQGLEVPVVPVLRTFSLEFWLKGLRNFGIEARVTRLPV
jgi:asparagine synthase (glutamine-hydrolysing)